MLKPSQYATDIICLTASNSKTYQYITDNHMVYQHGIRVLSHFIIFETYLNKNYISFKIILLLKVTYYNLNNLL